MHLSAAGMRLIRTQRVRDRTYMDVAGIATIGLATVVPGESFPDGIDETQGEAIL